MAWHRGDSDHYANRPDEIATLVERLRRGPDETSIEVERTGGYEKALVKALRQAQLRVEIVHTSRYKDYGDLLGDKEKCDNSDER